MSESLEQEYRSELARLAYVPPTLEGWTHGIKRVVEASDASPSEMGLEAHARRAIMAETPPINAELIPRAKEVVAGVGEWKGMNLVHPAICRACPGVDYNAEVCGVESGVLLLINEGLVYFVFHCLEVWARVAEFPLDRDDPTLSEEEAQDHVARAAVAYTQGIVDGCLTPKRSGGMRRCARWCRSREPG